MSHSKCHACGDNGHFVECKDVISDTKPMKVVHNEVIGLITDEDPVLSKMRRRGWYVASRCTVHVCNSRDMFVDYHPWSSHEVILDDKEPAEVAGVGTVVLRFTTGKVLTLSNVFHIPVLRKCLVSVSKLTDIGFKVSLWSGGTTIEKNHEIVGKGFIEDGLFRLSIMEPDTEPAKVVHNEVIGLITINEDPVLSKMRRRGWYLASRCTVHVSNSRDMFVDYQPWSGHEVILDNNEHVEVAGVGTVVLRFTTGKVLTLSNVFHIPVIRKCLVSVGKLTGIGFNVTLWSDGATIEKNHEIVGKGFVEDGLFRLSIMEPDTEPTEVVQNEVISLGNNSQAGVAGVGSVVLPLATGNALTLSNVRHAPAISQNILSISKLANDGVSTVFCGGGVTIVKNHEIVGKGYKKDGLYAMSIMEEHTSGSED